MKNDLQNKRNLARRLLLAAWIFAVSANVFIVSAQNSTVEARVTNVAGRAFVSGNGRGSARLNGGAALAPGDVIDTTGGGRVVIDLSDGSQIVVLPGSRVVFGDYQNAANLRELLQITLGRIRVKINHFQGKPNPYRIKSPTASIAVRGTEFLVTVEPLGETRVVVIEGAVEVASLANPAKKLVAEPKKGVIVRPNATVDFFVSGALTKEVGGRANRTASSGEKNDRNNDKDNDNGSGESANNVYERATESIVESGETALPSRFVAFPDAHLDSLENPAYADAFTSAEARFNFLPSLNGANTLNDGLRAQYGLTKPRPVDFSILPEGTIFVPVNRFGAVVGGSFGYVRNGLQSLSASNNTALDSPPFPVGDVGLRTVDGATSGSFFSGSLIAAKSFGGSEKTSVGFAVERLFSRGNLDQTTFQTDASGAALNQQISSHSSVNRTRLTFGVKHDFGGVRLGIFYRHSASAGTIGDVFRIVNGVPQTNNFVQSKGTTSEIGFRLRGAITKRLFYGAEGTTLFGAARQNFRRAAIAASTERDRIRRTTLGFGLGYVLRPRAIFSFDAAGGLIASNQRRLEDLTANRLETERQRARFFSLHAAVQTDVWRNLFVSASILSLTQSRVTDTTLFPDRFGRLLNSRGLFAPTGRTTDFYTDFYSNYGVGWRLKRNFILQYVLTTDYGQTSLRHTLLLRYAFDFKRQ